MISQLHYSPMKTEAIRDVIIESEKEIIHYVRLIFQFQSLRSKAAFSCVISFCDKVLQTRYCATRLSTP